jgi:hypothetical protein
MEFLGMKLSSQFRDGWNDLGGKEVLSIALQEVISLKNTMYR